MLIVERHPVLRHLLVAGEHAGPGLFSLKMPRQAASVGKVECRLVFGDWGAF